MSSGCWSDPRVDALHQVLTRAGAPVPTQTYQTSSSALDSTARVMRPLLPLPRRHGHELLPTGNHLEQRHCRASYDWRSPGDSADFTKLSGMEIIRTPIEDLIIFRPTNRDERGYFSRTLDVQILADAGIDPASFKQENQSRSYQGVRRGLHGRSGAGEAKLVRCVQRRGARRGRRCPAGLGDLRPGHEAFLLDDQVCTQICIHAGSSTGSRR